MNKSPRITDLERLAVALPPVERAVLDRIFHIETATGKLLVPEMMREWVIESFGSVEAVLEKEIVKVTNLITLEGSLFNPLRGVRPVDMVDQEDVLGTIESTRGGAFRQPEELTPGDVIAADEHGDLPDRATGRYCITASNIAKCDGFHSLIIFDEHNPLVISRERVHDYIQTALRWAKRAHNTDPSARYFLLM